LLYLLDANVLITAKALYYRFERVPEFWTWLIHIGERGDVKIVDEVYEEFKDGTDELATWAKTDEVNKALRLKEAVVTDLVRRVIRDGYADDLRDDEIEKLGRDPFLVAYALADPQQRVVVTAEASRPGRTRANRHLPDVCKDLGVPCCNTFDLTEALDFRTGWSDARDLL
jgi:hypothetical protein